MESLQNLAPSRKGRVIDLVTLAGLDVSDWSNSSRGAAGASTNPKYCYEWAFHDRDIVVLNLWHQELEEVQGIIMRRGNFRADAERNRRGKHPTWGARAHRVDVAIQEAATQGLPLRVILNAGRPREHNGPADGTSVVMYRELDPQPWCVTHYDNDTGAHQLTRGGAALFIDQFSMAGGPERPTEWRDRFGRVFVRNAEIRSAALLRAAGRCEYCGVSGFRTAAGSTYLESHHVLPLSEDGRDESTNVIALCANHHREAHHGCHRAVLRTAFQEILARAHALRSQGA